MGTTEFYLKGRLMKHIHLSACEQCGHEISHLGLTELPVEPMYDMRIAACLIPMRYEALRKWLYRNKAHFSTPRHRLHGHSHRRIRLLSASEIRLIRAKAIRGSALENPRVCERYVKAVLEVPASAEPACVMDYALAPQPTPEEQAEIERELLDGVEECTQAERGEAVRC